MKAQSHKSSKVIDQVLEIRITWTYSILSTANLATLDSFCFISGDNLLLIAWEELSGSCTSVEGGLTVISKHMRKSKQAWHDISY